MPAASSTDLGLSRDPHTCVASLVTRLIGPPTPNAQRAHREACGLDLSRLLVLRGEFPWTKEVPRSTDQSPQYFASSSFAGGPRFESQTGRVTGRSTPWDPFFGEELFAGAWAAGPFLALAAAESLTARRSAQVRAHDDRAVLKQRSSLQKEPMPCRHLPMIM